MLPILIKVVHGDSVTLNMDSMLYMTHLIGVLKLSILECLGLKGTTTDDSKMIVPPSLQGSLEVVEIPENLLFNGVSLPSVATFQIGDIMDADIISIIQDHQSSMGEDF